MDPSSILELTPSTATGEDSRTINCSGSTFTVTPSIFILKNSTNRSPKFREKKTWREQLWPQILQSFSISMVLESWFDSFWNIVMANYDYFRLLLSNMCFLWFLYWSICLCFFYVCWFQSCLFLTTKLYYFDEKRNKSYNYVVYWPFETCPSLLLLHFFFFTFFLCSFCFINYYVIYNFDYLI